MDLNSDLNKRQQVRYNKVCDEILLSYGSFNNIALHAFKETDEKITGETVRKWFRSQSIPTDFCFVLYEIMDRNFLIFDLLPWMRKYFTGAWDK